MAVPEPRAPARRTSAARALDGLDLARAVVESSPALVVVLDPDGLILHANAALQRFTGRTEAELLGQHFCDVYVVPEHHALARHAVATAVQEGVAHSQEGDWLTGAGTRRRISMQNSVIRDAAGRPVAVATIGVDVTENRRHLDSLHLRATTDSLTGVASRGVLFDALREVLDPVTGVGCGLLFCDVDDFKAVNDEHGHVVGDHLLVEMASRISEVAGPRDVVARFGGDEFVLLRPAADDDEVRLLSEALTARMRDPFLCAGRVLRSGISIGSATAGPGEDPDTLIARADRRMYRFKTRQRPSVRP
ncbi:diguanylate cyclase domain-containing protein [Blastococcus sp. SYSU D00820]